MTAHTGDPAARARSLASLKGDDAAIDAPGFARLLETAALQPGPEAQTMLAALAPAYALLRGAVAFMRAFHVLSLA